MLHIDYDKTMALSCVLLNCTFGWILLWPCLESIIWLNFTTVCMSILTTCAHIFLSGHKPVHTWTHIHWIWTNIHQIRAHTYRILTHTYWIWSHKYQICTHANWTWIHTYWTHTYTRYKQTDRITTCKYAILAQTHSIHTPDIHTCTSHMELHTWIWAWTLICILDMDTLTGYVYTHTSHGDAHTWIDTCLLNPPTYIPDMDTHRHHIQTHIYRILTHTYTRYEHAHQILTFI